MGRDASQKDSGDASLPVAAHDDRVRMHPRASAASTAAGPIRTAATARTRLPTISSALASDSAAAILPSGWGMASCRARQL